MPPSIKNEFSRSPVATVSAVVASLGSVGCLIGLIWYAAVWTARMEIRVEQVEKNEIGQIKRPEYDTAMLSLQRQLDDIKSQGQRQEVKMDKIYDALIKSNP